ncbi:MAG: ATPase, T2SS/T4P/T4SS family, partial [Patescibacteria group bacterium]
INAVGSSGAGASSVTPEPPAADLQAAEASLQKLTAEADAQSAQDSSAVESPAAAMPTNSPNPATTASTSTAPTAPPPDLATPPIPASPAPATSQTPSSPTPVLPPSDTTAANQATQASVQQPSTATPPSAVEGAAPQPQSQVQPKQPAPLQQAQESDGQEVSGSFSNLLEVLVKQGKVKQEDAEVLLMETISTGTNIEALIRERSIVSEEDLTRAKAIFHNTPFVKLTEVGTYPEAINQLPEGSARHYHMVPFAIDKSEGTLSVAMRDPLDLTAIDFAQQKTGLRIIAHYAMPTEVEKAIAEYYSQTLSNEVSAALEQTQQVAENQARKQDLSQLKGETIRQAPITKIVETMVGFAMKARASDIHIEPLEDRTRVRYRIDGILNEKLILPKSVHEAVISRIKILSGLKIDEKRLPQDGRFTFNTAEAEVDLRISTLPTIHGEKIVMRLLKKDDDVPTMPQLGLNGLALRNVQDAIKVPHGIVLITGPTGSGKTTTLYSVLHVINSPKVNIMTLEDPVEYQMVGVNQVQINPQAGLTFASGLRSFLRQDPNIIMVGEIRDSETAELAIQASLTGHLVFSTLHTSSAAGALPRLMDMGAEPFLLASSMTMVAAQRVLRLINSNYIEEYTPEPAVVEDVKAVLGEHYLAWCKKKNKDPNTMTLYRPSANRPQTEPEFKGRIAIFEVMRIDEQIAKLILERRPASEMEKISQKNGMLLMKQDGYLKALEGITTIEEVLRVAQI